MERAFVNHGISAGRDTRLSVVLTVRAGSRACNLCDTTPASAVPFRDAALLTALGRDQ